MKYLFLFFALWLILGCARQITVYTIGDSTMANKPEPEKNPERGWGQMLQDYFTDDVVVVNKAVNGRSTRSFIVENRWDSIYKVLKRGDYVFIQFGHNDGKETDPLRYTNPHTTYRYNLMKFVRETRQKGAHPVILSSISRRSFNEQGALIDKHGDYTMEARLVAEKLKVPFIDLQYLTELMEEKYGPEDSKQLHLHYKPGENEYFPDGKEDNTHLSIKGANEIAGLVVEQLKLLHLSLERKIR
ncbi:MAG: rhamnogalacturonan acetylesterase [Bacteroidales bacterium]